MTRKINDSVPEYVSYGEQSDLSAFSEYPVLASLLGDSSASSPQAELDFGDPMLFDPSLVALHLQIVQKVIEQEKIRSHRQSDGEMELFKSDTPGQHTLGEFIVAETHLDRTKLSVLYYLCSREFVNHQGISADDCSAFEAKCKQAKNAFLGMRILETIYRGRLYEIMLLPAHQSKDEMKILDSSAIATAKERAEAKWKSADQDLKDVIDRISEKLKTVAYREVIFCAECGLPFVPKRKGQRYHADACANLARKRRFNKKREQTFMVDKNGENRTVSMVG